MGMPQEPKPAKYFVALLLSDAELLTAMGASLWRCFLSFATLRAPAELAAIKLRTQQIEERYRDAASTGRRVNLDPGYLDSFKIVLASTKNAGQRIYLDGGIYGEATLMYHDGSFHGLPYTYRDYLWPETLAFLRRLRAAYTKALSKAG
jgi:uncharacterized protein DUF4416